MLIIFQIAVERLYFTVVHQVEIVGGGADQVTIVRNDHQRAFELAVKYAQQRSTFGKPIAEHQAVAFSLAEMATKVEAAHLMMVNAARLKDSGERNDVAAGMAKYLCSEYCAEVTQASFRIHGGYGYSKEFEIERLMRDAPFLLIGEGTSEIQKQIISKGLLREYQER